MLEKERNREKRNEIIFDAILYLENITNRFLTFDLIKNQDIFFFILFKIRV